MWCRVSLKTGKAVWPGEHWKKSKQIAREMERDLGLKRPTPRRFKKMFSKNVHAGSSYPNFGRRQKFGKRTYSCKRGKGNRGSSYSRTTKSSWRMSSFGYPAAWQQRSSKSSHTISTTGTGGKYLTPDGVIKLSANAANAQKFARQYPKTASTKSSRTFTPSLFKGGSSKSWHPSTNGGGTSGTHITTPHPVIPPFRTLWRPNKEEKLDQQPSFMPMRPDEDGGKCLAQRIDIRAVRDGKMTLAEYYRKWGGGGPRL